jgi:hypothetical protein
MKNNTVTGGISFRESFLPMHIVRLLLQPGDLPVQQSVKVQLVINLKTTSFSFTFPLMMLGRADEVTSDSAKWQLVALFCRAKGAEQCRLSGVNRPPYAHCEIFAF